MVAGELDAVFPDPVDELAEDLNEVPRPDVHEGDRDGDADVDVGFLVTMQQKSSSRGGIRGDSPRHWAV